jgi:hypothetical protein
MIICLRSLSVAVAVAIVCALLDYTAALAGPSITTEALGRLNDDPDHTFVVTIATKRGQERAVVQSLHIRQSEAFPEFGVIFVKATGNEVLNWSEIDDVEFVDVLDDVEATVVYHLVAQLHRIEFFDNLGVFQPGVLNLSIGPPRKLIGKDASGERTVRRVLQDVIERHGIPVVMSVGNDGPEPGLTNGWATQGVLLATAMNAAGTEVWSRASRFAPPMPGDLTMFGTLGIDTIGPRANCRAKSKEEIEAEERARLADVVGRENVPCYELATGTSFAAALLSRHTCLVHQAIGILALKLSSSTAANVELDVPAFIRAYIDNTFDRDHPYFLNRLADTQKHFGPLRTKISSAERQDAWDMLVGRAANISVRYNPRSLRAFLVHASAPVNGLSREQIGEGFLSSAAIRDMLLQLHYADLVEILGEDAPQRMTWVNRIRETRNPLVFTEQQVTDIEQYCANYDLVLGLPLLGRP